MYSELTSRSVYNSLSAMGRLEPCRRKYWRPSAVKNESSALHFSLPLYPHFLHCRESKPALLHVESLSNGRAFGRVRVSIGRTMDDSANSQQRPSPSFSILWSRSASLGAPSFSLSRLRGHRVYNVMSELICQGCATTRRPEAECVPGVARPSFLHYSYQCRTTSGHPSYAVEAKGSPFGPSLGVDFKIEQTPSPLPQPPLRPLFDHPPSIVFPISRSFASPRHYSCLSLYSSWDRV